MGSGTGGDIRVISQMPQTLRVCLCGFPFNPNITGVRGRTATAEMQVFTASLVKAHTFLKKAHAPAPTLDMSALAKTFASAQAVDDIQVELTELGHAFDNSLLEAQQLMQVELAQAVPPATGENPGIQLVAIVGEPVEKPALHPNSKQGRARRAPSRSG